jgi:aspartate kinase
MSNDFILSFGEKLSAPIISGAIIEQGIDSISLTGYDAGIITDSNYGYAEPIMTLTKENVSNKILPLFKKGIVPVITGFIGKDEKGVQTTLGRGGSDYTASIIGASISADEIIIWKDVKGFMTADPKIVPNARLINTLSYDEAIELASFGAKILHPRAIEPLIDEEIKMHIKYTFDPLHPGTFIHMPDPIARSPISGIATITKAALLRIGGTRKMSFENIVANTFKVLDDENVNVKMFGSATSEPIISLVIDEEYLKSTLIALKKQLEIKRDIKVNYETGYSIITVVGEGMRGRYGIAGEIFLALGNEKISIAMIAQSSSELNISFIVARKDRDKAVQLVHKNFNLDKSPWALEYVYEV